MRILKNGNFELSSREKDFYEIRKKNHIQNIQKSDKISYFLCVRFLNQKKKKKKDMNFFSLANALILSSLLISWAGATDLCYRINYNCDGNIDNCENSLLVQPLAKINAGHELLTGPQCGINYQENQLIPASGRWSQSGSSSNSGSCSNVDGGELMYAYHHPKSSQFKYRF